MRWGGQKEASDRLTLSTSRSVANSMDSSLDELCRYTPKTKAALQQIQRASGLNVLSQTTREQTEMAFLFSYQA